MIKKIIILTTFLIFNIIQVGHAKQLSNKTLVQIDNYIITELDLNKEVTFLKFLSKNELNNVSNEVLKKDTLNNLIERKVKSIEISNLKIEISEKETQFLFYNYLKDKKVSEEF